MHIHNIHNKQHYLHLAVHMIEEEIEKCLLGYVHVYLLCIALLDFSSSFKNFQKCVSHHPTYISLSSPFTHILHAFQIQYKVLKNDTLVIFFVIQ